MSGRKQHSLTIVRIPEARPRHLLDEGYIREVVTGYRIADDWISDRIVNTTSGRNTLIMKWEEDVPQTPPRYERWVYRGPPKCVKRKLDEVYED